MRNLTPENLKVLHTTHLIKPDASLLQLPEKILQFGTGILLRGLPGYLVDKANRQGLFQGRILAVKSTSRGPLEAFNQQHGLYTLAIRGIENKKPVEENIICSSLRRVLPATTHWRDVMQSAGNPDLKIIISNTTEAGLQLIEETIFQDPPRTFPGKLLAFLYRRYHAFKAAKGQGMVIIPTELVPENGQRLKEIIRHLTEYNKLEYQFTDWLEQENYFCNSLVDRIVPGKPDEIFTQVFESEYGYHDELLITAEPYHLWAVEGDEQIASMVSFSQADQGMIITSDINTYREIKLRLLNGAHTLSCGVSFLADIPTVKGTMDHPLIASYINRLMFDEIIPSIPYPVDKEKAADFARKVLDRFRNPYIHHQWLDISTQYTVKMKMRVVPILLRHYELFTAVPKLMAFGFAAYFFFMKINRQQDHRYFAGNNGSKYTVTDSEALYFYTQWKRFHGDTDALTEEVLRNIGLWGTDLTGLPGFADSVKAQLHTMSEGGMLHALQTVL